MIYICWKDYKDCIVGNNYECIDGWIMNSDVKLCAEHSQDAHYHFSINDDGHGLERGPLVYKIAYAPRQRQWEEEVIDPETGEETEVEVTRTARFLPEEAEYMFNHFPQFFTDDRFNDYFYTQSHIEEVEALADYLK